LILKFPKSYFFILFLLCCEYSAFWKQNKILREVGSILFCRQKGLIRIGVKLSRCNSYGDYKDNQLISIIL